MATHDISEAEAAIYDRQIRLWGLDAQKRLRSSKVLICGMGGLGSEICKNIVLAGIKAVVLLDHEVVSIQDTACQFFIRRSDIGKNRAESSKENVQVLNPMVEVTTDTGLVTEKTESFFKDFNVVCVTNLALSDACRINSICRKNNIQFFCGEVFGVYGYSFFDLGTHSYAEEIKKHDTTNTEGKKKEPETIVVKKEMEFVSLEKAIAGICSTVPKKVNSTYFVLRLMMEFNETYSRNPKCSQFDEDSALLVKLLKHLLDKIGIQRSLDESVTKQVMGELSYSCAVVGGVVAQEIIKAVSCKDKPFDNFLLYEGTTGEGTIEHFGSR